MSAVLVELSMWIVNWRVVQAIMALWEAEEALQTVLLGAFNMNTMKMKKYVPEYFEMEKQRVLSKLNEIDRAEFQVVPFAEGAFRAFFAAGYYAIDAYGA